MKKIVAVIAIGWGILFAGSAMAIPTLQLDIDGGGYDPSTQTIISAGDTFTLYAYLDPNRFNLLSDTYYISAAVTPKVATDTDLGSFMFNGDVLDVTGDMVYGVPPLEQNLTALWDSGDLARHGIYSTYFAEFEFQFLSSQQIAEYNTQDRAINGDPINFGGNGMYYVAFTVDTSGLDQGYDLHFDLYNTKLKCGGDIDVSQFAPFSHDAGSQRVPEPGTLLLLGSGLLGLGILTRRRN